MAPKNSKGYRTPAEEQLRSFMEQASAQGRAEEVLAIIQQSFDATPGVVDHQAMSDASKRRREQQSTWDDAVVIPGAAISSAPPSVQQVPVEVVPKQPPAVPKQPPTVQLPEGVRSLEEWGRTIIREPSDGGIQRPPHRVLLPEGVRSLEEWGRTVCKLPKVVKRGMTYQELAAEGNTNQDTYNYLSKFVLCHNGTSAKVHDFKQSLIAIDFKRRSPMTEAPSTMSTRTVRE